MLSVQCSVFSVQYPARFQSPVATHLSTVLIRWWALTANVIEKLYYKWHHQNSNSK